MGSVFRANPAQQNETVKRQYSRIGKKRIDHFGYSNTALKVEGLDDVVNPKLNCADILDGINFTWSVPRIARLTTAIDSQPFFVTKGQPVMATVDILNKIRAKTVLVVPKYSTAERWY